MNVIQPSERNSSAGFSILELIIVLGIIAILQALAIQAYVNYQKKAYSTEMLSYLAVEKQQQALYYQIHGRWPDEETAKSLTAAYWDEKPPYGPEAKEYSYDEYQSNGGIEYGGSGSFTAYISHPGDTHLLSYRFLHSELEGSTNLVWLCGYKKRALGKGFFPLAENKTDIDPVFLTFLCK